MGLAPLLGTTPELDTEIAEEHAHLAHARSSSRRGIGMKTGAALSVLGFLLLWCGFFAFSRAVPYVANGSDIVKVTKKNLIAQGKAFPRSYTGTKLAVFGNSKVLSGFVPDRFDSLAASDQLPVYSFNAGLPAQSEFVHELGQMADKGAVPDVVLLTIPWRPTPRGNPLFTLPADDNAIADTVFPFRLLVRNLARFVADSARYGGPASLYRREKAEADSVLSTRGYYFIKGQIGFTGDSLPANYSLPTDDPTHVAMREADFSSAELAQINRIVEQHKIRCFYVPGHLRTTEAAPAPPVDTQFATGLAQRSPCRAIGPDYFTYSPLLYSDEAHLNQQGAQVYTQDIYRLISPYLKEGPNALQ
jgi:hypothetical protein